MNPATQPGRPATDGSWIPTHSHASKGFFQRNAPSRAGGQQGIALIAVLWIVAALSIISTGVVNGLRQEARTLGMESQQLRAQALGDAAIQITLQSMQANSQALERLVWRDVTYRGVAIRVQAMPLTGLIDINAAGLPLLQQMFRVAGGLTPDAARSLVQAVMQYRQQPDARGVSQRFAAVSDLMRVPGMDYDLYARLAPLLTTDVQGTGRINPLAAPQQVLAVLADGNTELAHRIASARDAGQAGIDTSALDGSLIDTSVSRRVRVQAYVPMADGRIAYVSRSVDLDARRPDGSPWSTFHMATGLEPERRQTP